MSQIISSEQTILELLRTLPTERVAQVLDFVRFLQWQMTPEIEPVVVENEDEIRTDNERWDKTFATSSDTLRYLAQEARTEIQAGRTQAMVFTADGRIVPG